MVCAVGDGEVGADIQKWVPYKERTAERFFAPTEWKLLQELPASQRTELFYRLWSRKEAYGKYTGQGSAVQWEKISPTNRTGRKSRYVSGNGFWRIAIRWRSVTEQQKRKRKERESCKGIGSMKSGCALHGKREEMRTL